MKDIFMATNKKATSKHKKALKRKEVIKGKISKVQKSNDEQKLDDVLNGEYGHIFKLTKKWIDSNPLGTYAEIPEEVLNAWAVGCADVMRAMDANDELPSEAEEAMQLSFLTGMFAAEIKRSGTFPKKKTIQFLELFPNWILAITWCGVMRGSETPNKDLDGVVVFDPVFLAKIDDKNMREKMASELENATMKSSFFDDEDECGHCDCDSGCNCEDCDCDDSELWIEETMDASDFVSEAWEANDAVESVELAQKAIELDADCADAYLVLATYLAKTNDEKIKFCQQGVDAGERSLGKDCIKENSGHLWACHEARGFLRAKHSLATALANDQRFDDARKHYDELFVLNPNDNQGVRYSYMGLLLQLNALDRAEELFSQYKEDASSQWMFNEVLLDFKKSGNDVKNTATNKKLKAAHKKNKFVIGYLANPSSLPATPPDCYTLGDSSEAEIYLMETKGAWMSTSGAIEWAKSVLGK